MKDKQTTLASLCMPCVIMGMKGVISAYFQAPCFFLHSLQYVLLVYTLVQSIEQSIFFFAFIPTRCVSWTETELFIDVMFWLENHLYSYMKILSQFLAYILSAVLRCLCNEFALPAELDFFCWWLKQSFIEKRSCMLWFFFNLLIRCAQPGVVH